MFKKERGINMKSSPQSIEALIEIKRKEMVETAIKTGFTSEMTLKQSKELDFLLNLFQKKIAQRKV
jgi:Spo0E like sporulation regulatory protein